MWRVISIIVMTIVIGLSNCYAQTVIKKINGISYEVKDGRKSIKRVDRPTKGTYSELGKDYEIVKNDIAPSIIKNVIGTKRLKELLQSKKYGLVINFTCDSTGNVKYVRFSSTSGIGFTDEEIYKLEQAYLKKQFPIKVYSHTKQMYDLNFSVHVTFSKIVESE